MTSTGSFALVTIGAIKIDWHFLAITWTIAVVLAMEPLRTTFHLKVLMY